MAREKEPVHKVEMTYFKAPDQAGYLPRLAFSFLMMYNEYIKRASAHKVEAIRSIYVLHEDAPILFG